MQRLVRENIGLRVVRWANLAVLPRVRGVCKSVITRSKAVFLLALATLHSHIKVTELCVSFRATVPRVGI